MNPKALLKKISNSKRNNLTELESREILEHYKIPLVKASLAKAVDDVAAISKKMGYPIVMKVVSPQVVHKSDVGGVVLNINNEDEAKTAFEKIMKSVKKKIPKAKIEGILIEKQISGGQEIIVGGKEDFTFGKVLMFGLGGVFTEVFNDVSIRVTPVSRNDCLSMIKETKGYKILSGYRGKNYDINSIVSVLLKTSKLLEDNKEIKELDINPVMVSESGAVAVDARIIV